MASLFRVFKGVSSTEPPTSDSAWSLLGIGLVIGGSSALVGYYIGKRREQHKQKFEHKKVDLKLQKRQRVIPGDFKELNEKMLALVDDEICSLTGELSSLRRKRDRSMRMECTRWKEELGTQRIGSHVKSAALYLEVDLKIWNDRIEELKYKIIQLQKYVTPPRRPLLSTDPENAPEIFCCPISYDIMEKPVIAADGYTYEEEIIRMWLRTSRVSPKTNQEMHSTLLQPNNALRLAIQSWREDVRLQGEEKPCNEVTIRSSPSQAGCCCR